VQQYSDAKVLTFN